MNRYISFLSDIGYKDLVQVGGKGANLGELIRAGFAVPPGFSVRSLSYERFLDANNLKEPIKDIAANIDFLDLGDVWQKTAHIREMLIGAQVPEDIAQEIIDGYKVLQEDGDPPLVAIRSSVGTKNLARSSFPGQMDTFHNVRGGKPLLGTIRKCWASVWSSRSASTLHSLGMDPFSVIIAPVVQRMVLSEVAGVLFTANPINGKSEEMLIDAAFGLGEAVVSGALTPDHYVISKKGLEVLSKVVGHKRFKLELDTEKGSGNRKVMLFASEANRECLAAGQVRELAELGIALEGCFGKPQDVEWAYSEGKLFLLQSREIAGLAKTATEGERQ